MLGLGIWELAAVEDRSGAGPGPSAADEGKSSDQGKAVQGMRQSTTGASLVVTQ